MKKIKMILCISLSMMVFYSLMSCGKKDNTNFQVNNKVETSQPVLTTQQTPQRLTENDFSNNERLVKLMTAYRHMIENQDVSVVEKYMTPIGKTAIELILKDWSSELRERFSSCVVGYEMEIIQDEAYNINRAADISDNINSLGVNAKVNQVCSFEIEITTLSGEYVDDGIIEIAMIDGVWYFSGFDA